MLNYAAIRISFVKIHRERNGKYSFSGLNVMGRDRKGHIANRILWLDHASPEWFRELCDEYADTNIMFEVRVTRLHNLGVALIAPTAKTKAGALDQYKQRYGSINVIKNIVVPEEDPPSFTSVHDSGFELTGDPETAYDHAFRIHENVARRDELEVLEHVREGLKSFTRVRKAGHEYKIVGGMLVNKVVKEYDPTNAVWRRTVNVFVRVQTNQ